MNTSLHNHLIIIIIIIFFFFFFFIFSLPLVYLDLPAVPQRTSVYLGDQVFSGVLKVEMAQSRPSVPNRGVQLWAQGLEPQGILQASLADTKKGNCFADRLSAIFLWHTL